MEGLLSPGLEAAGRLPTLGDRTRSGPGRQPLRRDGRGDLRLLSELGHPEDALPRTVSVTGEGTRSLRSASV